MAKKTSTRVRTENVQVQDSLETESLHGTEHVEVTREVTHEVEKKQLIRSEPPPAPTGTVELTPEQQAIAKEVTERLLIHYKPLLDQLRTGIDAFRSDIRWRIEERLERAEAELKNTTEKAAATLSEVTGKMNDSYNKFEIGLEGLRSLSEEFQLQLDQPATTRPVERESTHSLEYRALMQQLSEQLEEFAKERAAARQRRATDSAKRGRSDIWSYVAAAFVGATATALGYTIAERNHEHRQYRETLLSNARW